MGQSKRERGERDRERVREDGGKEGRLNKGEEGRKEGGGVRRRGSSVRQETHTLQ